MSRRLTGSALKVVVGLFAMVAFAALPTGCSKKCCGGCKTAKGDCKPGCTKPCCKKAEQGK